ncbi:MAG: RNA polymerase sigma factor [Gemmataceae bacterium]
MPLTPQDRELLQRCLDKEPGSWNDFVDGYLGLIYHVIHHTSHLRSIPLTPEDVEDLAAEVLLQIVADDYAVLRQFQKKASLSTYLAVIARRICVKELARRAAAKEVQTNQESTAVSVGDSAAAPSGGLETLEEVAKLLRKLPPRDRDVVRLCYLEGRSYEEISSELGIPLNSIGPILSRAKKKMREDVKSPPRELKIPRDQNGTGKD